MGVAADHEPAGVHAPGGQPVDLFEEHPSVDDDTVADDRRDVGVQDAARDELEGEGLAVDDDAVPGVVTTLVAADDVHLACQEVGQLAFALVTPLGPDDHGYGHASSSVCGYGLRLTLPGPAGRTQARMGPKFWDR